MPDLETIKCLVVDDEPLARLVILDHVSKIDFLEVVGESKNAIEANTFLNSNKVDLIFLDINMPYISGIEFARQLNPNPVIIFTTAYSEFAVEGFELEALDYLVKPITFNRFLQTSNRILKWFGKTNEPSESGKVKKQNQLVETPFVYLKAEDKMVRIELPEIIAIESQGHYIKIYTSETYYLIHQSISEMESRLPGNKFVRTHRSFIVNLDYVKAYSSTLIETEKLNIPIGRSYKQKVVNKL